MKLELQRSFRGDQYTIGHLYIDGAYFCDTIEDCDRGLRKDMQTGQLMALKKYGITAIPTGLYQVRLTYSPKFKQIMPELMNVPVYSGVRIHTGNTAEDSLGCIIVGENKVKGKVINSRATYARLMGVLKTADNIDLEIV